MLLYFRHCFLHVYLPLLQNELNDFKEQHNSHRIRKQKDRRVPNGVPDDLYLFPEIHGNYHGPLFLTSFSEQTVKSNYQNDKN